MTHDDWRLIILGLIGLLQAIGLVAVPLLIQRGRKEVGVVGAKVDVGNATTDVVHAIVNSAADEMRRELAAAKAEIKQLSALLSAAKKKQSKR